MSAAYTCPCCGYRTLTEHPGSYDICPICFWEDDPVQLLDPSYAGGANAPSLIDCQANYQRCGACEDRFIKNVRPPGPADVRDINWRPAQDKDAQTARRPADLTHDEYSRLEVWYYWQRETA